MSPSNGVLETGTVVIADDYAMLRNGVDDGQAPAQMPQPAHRSASTTASERPMRWFGCGTIVTAGAILPLTQLPVRDKSLGTRHRAALGLSEETDAVVVVVSEETSRISVAQRGRIEIGVDEARLREILTAVLGAR